MVLSDIDWITGGLLAGLRVRLLSSIEGTEWIAIRWTLH